jgi:DNA-directed RNA polymerase subunit N (RpoN/RPB10)
MLLTRNPFLVRISRNVKFGKPFTWFKNKVRGIRFGPKPNSFLTENPVHKYQCRRVIINIHASSSHSEPIIVMR